jgi:tetratricopeptide (TPR) repeat protein
MTWYRKNEFDRAIRDCDEAIRLDAKSDLAFLWRGWAWQQKRAYDQAEKDFEGAIRISAGAIPAMKSLAQLLATCPDSTVRNGQRALALARKVCELAKWSDAGAFEILAVAYAETGRFDQAIECEQRALADSDYIKKCGEAARNRLELFKQKKPYRSE